MVDRLGTTQENLLSFDHARMGRGGPKAEVFFSPKEKTAGFCPYCFRGGKKRPVGCCQPESDIRAAGFPEIAAAD